MTYYDDKSDKIYVPYCRCMCMLYICMPLIVKSSMRVMDYTWPSVDAYILYFMIFRKIYIL